MTILPENHLIFFVKPASSDGRFFLPVLGSAVGSIDLYMAIIPQVGI
jgi:hypothetical protein